jgi:pimeloyl-ACP methyl ester carboxylesterase
MIMKNFIYLSLALLVSLSIQAGELPRRGMLGVHLAPDSTQQSGAIVQKVIPNGSADRMGVIDGDRIISVNGNETNSFKELMKQLGETKKTKDTKLVLLRKGKKIEVRGELLPTPFVVKNEYILNSFDYKGNKIRTIIEKPEGKGPFPTIYYIQGYPCQSCEYTDPNSPLRRFIDDLVGLGYLVYRVEKPNMGDSRGELQCDEITFTTEDEVFSKGYDELLKSELIDKNKIAIFGHSLGGMHAPIISAEKKPAATIVYGIRIDSWYDYLLKTFDVQFPLWSGGDYVQGNDVKNQVRDYLYQIYYKGKSAEDMIDSDSTRRLFQIHLNYMGDNKFFGRNSDFFVDLNATNIVKYWSEVRNPVLSLHGQYDLQALDNESAKKIEEIVDYYNGKDIADFIEVPNTEHIFMKVESQKQVAQLSESGQMFKYAADNYNDEIPLYIHNWLKKVYERNN